MSESASYLRSGENRQHFCARCRNGELVVPAPEKPVPQGAAKAITLPLLNHSRN